MATKPAQTPKTSRITIPNRAHPAAKIVFSEMARQGITYEELAHYSGVQVTTIKAWRKSNRPGLETIEACLGHLGWSFLPVPPRAWVPAEIQAELDVIAAKWEGINPTLCQLMATVAQAPIIDVTRAEYVPPPKKVTHKWPKPPSRKYVPPGQSSLL